MCYSVIFVFLHAGKRQRRAGKRSPLPDLQVQSVDRPALFKMPGQFPRIDRRYRLRFMPVFLSLHVPSFLKNYKQ
jgi:hypothetical protein